MTRFALLALTIVLLAVPLPAGADDAPLGFFVDRVAAQRDAEAVFHATPAPARARAWLAHLTEEPHVAGTPAEKKVAAWVHEQFEAMGLEAETVRYDVFLNHPKAVSLALVEPVQEALALREDALDEDKDSTAEGLFPAFHGYGASGTARGQVVYVNYGTPADYATLDQLGVSVDGRIVLARYGQVFRGLKVREAEQRGALGVILYSDPADDGYMRGDVYPDGPMRHPSAIQRGSVQYLSIQPGDPSTPGYPSRDGAPRLARAEMKSVPRIPSLPISYREAEKILRRLAGPNVPDGWQGGLPFAYHVGPGGAAVSMSVEMDEGQKPIFNVFARIRGTEKPERIVILGNHRDAWNHGAVDPNSGTAAMLETARGLAAAVQAGWRPKRTIVLASWDAEEYGLVGSVEWGEDRADDLRAQAVAYLNLDSAVTGGDFDAQGTPSLTALVRETIAEIPDPVRGGMVGPVWEARVHGDWASGTPVDLAAPDAAFELRLPPLGSGSDYTVFVDHLGVPAVNFGFGGKYGVYHSAYDTFRWMERFGDPQFVYHVAAARFYGLLTMRLAAADVVPLRFGAYAATLRDQLDDLRRAAIRKRRGPRDAGSDALFVPDFAPVLRALDGLATAGAAADAHMDAVVAAQDVAAASRLSDDLRRVEQAFLDEGGLPGRPWFRHLLVAPGTTTGYAPWPFPELAEALHEDDGTAFARAVERVVAAIDRGADQLRSASR